VSDNNYFSHNDGFYIANAQKALPFVTNERMMQIEQWTKKGNLTKVVVKTNKRAFEFKGTEYSESDEKGQTFKVEPYQEITRFSQASAAKQITDIVF